LPLLTRQWESRNAFGLSQISKFRSELIALQEGACSVFQRYAIAARLAAGIFFDMDPKRTKKIGLCAVVAILGWFGFSAEPEHSRKVRTLGETVSPTNAMVAVVSPDGLRVYVVNGEEDLAMKLSRQAIERVRAARPPKDLPMRRVFR